MKALILFSQWMACIFLSYGHYGSTVYDPMSGDSIDIVICDLCINENKDCVYGNGKEDLTS